LCREGIRGLSWKIPDGEIGIEAMHEGKTLFYGSCKSDTSDPSSYWKRLAYGTKALVELAPATRRPTGLMLSALVAMEHLKLLHEFAVMLSESGTTVRLGVGVGTDMVAIRTSTRFMLPVYLELGGFLFFAVTLNDISDVEVEGLNVTFRLKNPTVHRSCVLAGTADENRPVLKAEIARGRNTCPGGVTGLVHTDFPDEDAQPETG
jgi:hypothetical protein